MASKKKPGMLKRLFSSKKLSISEDYFNENDKAAKVKLQRSLTVDPAALTERTADDVIAAAMAEQQQRKSIDLGAEAPRKGKKGKDAKKAMKESNKKSAPPPKKPNKKLEQFKESEKPLDRQGSQASLRKKQKKNKSSNLNIDVSKPIDFPCTPEMMLSYHKHKSFLNPTQEWLIVELNEYECLIENVDIIKIMAKHSKFFEIEPDELIEEFFNFVDEVPTYDEIINWDVWQEFRDKRYPY